MNKLWGISDLNLFLIVLLCAVVYLISDRAHRRVLGIESDIAVVKTEVMSDSQRVTALEGAFDQLRAEHIRYACNDLWTLRELSKLAGSEYVRREIMVLAGKYDCDSVNWEEGGGN